MRRGLWALGFLVATSLAGENSLSEYQVKAAFIYKFATYVRWPQRPGADPNAFFIIGVLGKDPFGREIDEVMRGQNVHGRPVVVRRLSRPEEASACDILFIASSERALLRQILASLHDAPVLTVGDMDQFAEMGGMINLTTENNHIGFDINKGAIDRSGLKVASQLLGLARIVEDKR